MTKIYLSKSVGHIRSSPSLKDSIDNLSEWNFVISIEREKKIRSPNQNRFYWWVFLPVLTETGYTVEELHELFKKMFLSKTKRLTKLGRKTITITKSTAELSTIEWEDFIQKIRDFIQPLGYILPIPNEESIS